MQLPIKIKAGAGVQRFSAPRTALIHYWYFRRRGGERVFDVIADVFPQADIFMILCDFNALSPAVMNHRVSTSLLNRLPKVKNYYRALLPFFPFALEQFDLTAYDLVISHEAGPAKGVLTRSDTRHICYCHTPLRYLWDMYHDYLRAAPGGPLGRAAYALISHYVRRWDFQTSARVDEFLASSQNSARRIRKYYRRDSNVLYPPVNLSSFSIHNNPARNFYLVVSPLVKYKRVDLAIEACNKLRRNLVVIGDGEQRKTLQGIAGPTVSFFGHQPDAVVREHFRNCKALLFPGEEDIGLTPIEAQASGRPVIAYGRGGALETIQAFYPDESMFPDLHSGLFFREQSAESLAEAMCAFERVEPSFRPGFVRRSVQRFDEGWFRQGLLTFVANSMQTDAVCRTEEDSPVSIVAESMLKIAGTEN